MEESQKVQFTHVYSCCWLSIDFRDKTLFLTHVVIASLLGVFVGMYGLYLSFFGV